LASNPSAYEGVRESYDSQGLYRLNEYIKKLLIERHGIRAALENPGGSIITAGPARAADADDMSTSYSSVIGNDYHLDLLDAEQAVNKLPLQERIETLAWCDGLSPKQAAQWANITSHTVRSTTTAAARKRMQRTITKIANGVADDAA
jgi:hypothetical protein